MKNKALFLSSLAGISIALALFQVFVIPDKKDSIKIYPIILVAITFTAAVISPHIYGWVILAVGLPAEILNFLLRYNPDARPFLTLVMCALFAFFGMAAGRVWQELILKK